MLIEQIIDFNWVGLINNIINKLINKINKSNFFELPSKLVTDREIAEPTVIVLIYVFSVLQECFLTIFTLAVFQVKRSVFVPPLNSLLSRG